MRRVASMRNSWLATMLDTKGPEIRTAMLREGKDLDLKKGQEVILVAVGDEYTTWEGFHDPSSGVRDSPHTPRPLPTPPPTLLPSPACVDSPCHSHVSSDGGDVYRRRGKVPWGVMGASNERTCVQKLVRSCTGAASDEGRHAEGLCAVWDYVSGDSATHNRQF